MKACLLGAEEEPLSAWGSALLPFESAMVDGVVKMPDPKWQG